MASLLQLCRQCGLKSPTDYFWSPYGPIITEAGERKIKALAAQDPVLLDQLYEATGHAVELRLTGDPTLSKRQRKSGERLLRHAPRL